MLTAEELQRAVQSLVDDWKKTYPTPWPLLQWLDSIHQNMGGGVDLCGKFLVAILPSPEWLTWFTQTAMHTAFHGWGAVACREEIDRVHSQRALEEKTVANQWLHERDDRLIVLMQQHWFPDWKPTSPRLYFPTKGITPQAGIR